MKKEDILNKSYSEAGLMLEFYSKTCRPCRMMEPIVEGLSGQAGFPGVVKAEVSEEEGLARGFGISSVPSFILLKEGKEIARRHGVCSTDEMKAFVKVMENF